MNAAKAKASERAARLAQDNYEVGAATQLDLLQAQRDAYSAMLPGSNPTPTSPIPPAQLRLAAGRDPLRQSRERNAMSNDFRLDVAAALCFLALALPCFLLVR